MDANNLIILVDGNEPVWKSWARDAATFGGLIGSAVTLNVVMPPSGWLNCGLAFAWIVWMFGRAAKHKHVKTPEQARDWLDERFPRKVAA